MLPRLDRLSLKPTGEFYALTPDEAAEEGEDPIHGHAFLPGQPKDSLAATFRVRSKDPRPGTTNEYVYHFFEAASLWQWVKREDRAFNPKTREPLWKEDWLALHNQFEPGSPVPYWVRYLPRLRPDRVDNAPPPAPTINLDWAEDLKAAFSLSSDFVDDDHGDTPIEQAITGLVQVLRRIKTRDGESPVEYRYHIETYDHNNPGLDPWNPAWGDPPPSLTDLIDNLLVLVSRYDTISQRVRAASVGFVAYFLQYPGAYLQRVADYVYDEDNVDHDRLRLGLDEYFMHVTNATDFPPLMRHVTRLNALRVRHHTFWNRPILDRHLKGPPPPARVLTVWDVGRTHDAALVLLKEKMEAATSVMANFSHEQDDVEGFFQLEEYSHYSLREYATVGTELLEELAEMFRKSVVYTQEDDGARRALTITFFANVLNMFVELSMWNDTDYGLFGDMWDYNVQDWAKKVASTLRSVVRKDDSLPLEASERVTTFFWWYVAPLYEMGTVSNQISETRLAYGPPHLDQDDVLKGLSLLDETVERLPADPPTDAAHERPSGEATPGRRRQRTEA
tara:strand:+ start:2205 stop:3893 length:1689 start_codon:yes stop_codon:yes gene_type:complete